MEAGTTKGQIAGGRGYGVPKDKLLEVEAMGYQRTSCWRWRLGVPKDKLLEVEARGVEVRRRRRRSGGGSTEEKTEPSPRGEEIVFPTQKFFRTRFFFIFHLINLFIEAFFDIFIFIFLYFLR